MPEFRTYRRAAESLDLRSVLDWCTNGGRRARELDKHATWSGIERRSRLWHGRIWQAPQKEAELSWSSALGPCEISGVRVIPLTTSRALWEEGRAMQHCVTTYASRCAVAGYRVFALVGETERATLGIIEVGGRWKVDQARGWANGSVSEPMKAVAGAVARAYRGGTAALARRWGRPAAPTHKGPKGVIGVSACRRRWCPSLLAKAHGASAARAGSGAALGGKRRGVFPPRRSDVVFCSALELGGVQPYNLTVRRFMSLLADAEGKQLKGSATRFG